MDRLPLPNNSAFTDSLLSMAWDYRPEAEYRIILLYFTPRALTNQGDALLAMAGIIRRLSIEMKSSFFQGIPVAAFDTFLVSTAIIVCFVAEWAFQVILGVDGLDQ